MHPTLAERDLLRGPDGCRETSPEQGMFADYVVHARRPFLVFFLGMEL